MSHKLAQQKPESSLPVLPLDTVNRSENASTKNVITTIEVLRELDRVVEDSAVLEFEAKRNTANQGKTLETFLALAKAKRYSDKVTNKAVQEVVGSLKFYNATKGMVVTTNDFTKSAQELAKSNNVELINREKLDKLIQQYW